MTPKAQAKEAQAKAPGRIRLPYLTKAKLEGRKLTMLTAYDALTAPLLEQAGVDMLLVGDSLSNVTLGFSSTLSVTLEDMERATAAVARSTTRAFIVTDLPFGSYEASTQEAFHSAERLLRAGAGAVKLEGGIPRAATIEFLVNAGIPVMGHLGYTPQAEHMLGGPSLQGKGTQAKQMLEDAKAVAEAGAFGVVLEMVPASLAQEITATVPIPTIGIGAGAHCDGQVLVWADAVGMGAWAPSFAKRYANVGEIITEAASKYVREVQSGEFPGAEYSREV